MNLPQASGAGTCMRQSRALAHTSLQPSCSGRSNAACAGARDTCEAARRPPWRSQERRHSVFCAARLAEGKGAELSYRAAEPGLAVQVSAPEDDSDVLIELKDVWKSFGSNDILRGCNMKIRRGEAVGIIGGSGTGKSTTLRIMAGLLAPDRGEVRILGQARQGLLSDDAELAARLSVGMVFQNGALFDSLTVGENVGFLLYEHTRLADRRIRELVADSLASVGLSGVEDLLPSELSGGMRKRVALARAIVRDDAHSDAEQVIMYDEPTAGLDPVASTVVEDLVRSLHDVPGAPGNGARAGGISAYIVVTHQHSTIRRAVDRLIFLHQGQVVWEGKSEDFDESTNPFVQQFATGSLAGPIRYE